MNAETAATNLEAGRSRLCKLDIASLHLVQYNMILCIFFLCFFLPCLASIILILFPQNTSDRFSLQQVGDILLPYTEAKYICMFEAG